MRELARWLVLVVGLTLATWLMGWWAVPALGALWGAVRGLQRDALAAGLAAMVAWGLLLGHASIRGPVAELAVTLGGILNVPAAVLVLMTLLFSGLLAASSAGMAAGMRAALNRELLPKHAD